MPTDKSSVECRGLGSAGRIWGARVCAGVRTPRFCCTPPDPQFHSVLCLFFSLVLSSFDTLALSYICPVPTNDGGGAPKTDRRCVGLIEGIPLPLGVPAGDVCGSVGTQEPRRGELSMEVCLLVLTTERGEAGARWVDPILKPWRRPPASRKGDRGGSRRGRLLILPTPALSPLLSGPSAVGEIGRKSTCSTDTSASGLGLGTSRVGTSGSLSGISSPGPGALSIFGTLL
eukprot:Hpha_TRINITY_DN15374_c1_g4::TRINITY_DN15374_c1_g4_i3::g.90709::m.90709